METGNHNETERRSVIVGLSVFSGGKTAIEQARRSFYHEEKGRVFVERASRLLIQILPNFGSAGLLDGV